MDIDISDIVADFPDFRVAVVIAEGLEIGADRPRSWRRSSPSARRRPRAKWAGRELADIPGIAAWRRAYRAFGIKRTSYRSSVERLVKNVQAGRGLPRINPFVDAYNAVSLTHVMPLGADDLAKVDRRPRLPLQPGRRRVPRHGLGRRRRRAAARSAEARRGGLCRRREDPLPALELAAGPALAGDGADRPGRGHRPVERRGRPRRGGRRPHRPDRAVLRRHDAGHGRRPAAADHRSRCAQRSRCGVDGLRPNICSRQSKLEFQPML